MSDVRLVFDYDNEDIESLAVTEAALLSQVFDIRNRKETLINIAVKENLEEQNVEVKEEPDTAEPQPEPETSELEEAVAAFRQATAEFGDALDNLVTLSGMKCKLEGYDEIRTIIDEILQGPLEEEKK